MKSPPGAPPNQSLFQVGHLIWTIVWAERPGNSHLGKSLWHPKIFKKEIPLLGNCELMLQHEIPLQCFIGRSGLIGAIECHGLWLFDCSTAPAWLPTIHAWCLTSVAGGCRVIHCCCLYIGGCRLVLFDVGVVALIWRHLWERIVWEFHWHSPSSPFLARATSEVFCQFWLWIPHQGDCWDDRWRVHIWWRAHVTPVGSETEDYNEPRAFSPDEIIVETVHDKEENSGNHISQPARYPMSKALKQSRTVMSIRAVTKQPAVSSHDCLAVCDCLWLLVTAWLLVTTTATTQSHT